MSKLPLFELFQKLQDSGFLLGVSEYEMFLKALKAGFGISDRESLSHLCRTLWVKNFDEYKVFEYYFDQFIPQAIDFEPFPSIPEFYQQAATQRTVGRFNNRTKNHFFELLTVIVIGGFLVYLFYLFFLFKTVLQGSSSKSESLQPHLSVPEKEISVPEKEISVPEKEGNKLLQEKPQTLDFTSLLVTIFIYSLFLFVLFLLSNFSSERKEKNHSRSVSVVSNPNPDDDIQKFSDITRETRDVIQIIQAMSNPKPNHNSSSVVDYCPITSRQMKQCWRYLRRFVRAGPATELDIDSTVNRIGQNGFLLNPVLIPPRVNQTELLLLIDYGGSMVPFHMFAHLLAKTAIRGSRLGKVTVYYFHNVPTHHLYLDIARVKYKKIETIFNELHSSSKVIIFSDAGATRGSLSLSRYRQTWNILQSLHTYTHHIAWLNPLPKERWIETTADKISTIVPMLEIDHKGLDTAIQILRGKYRSIENLEFLGG